MGAGGARSRWHRPPILSVAVTSTALSEAAQSEVATIAGYPPTDGALDPEDVNDLDEIWAPDGPTPDWTSPPADPSESPRPTPSASPTPTPQGTTRPAAQPKALLKGSLPAGLRPSLGEARDDEDRLIRDGCGVAIGGSEPPDCVYGDKHGDLTLALVGDSHAMNWFPAFERVAIRRHWRLVPFAKYSCVFVDMRIWSDYLKREYTECESWRERVVGRLRRLKPDLVVISSNKWFPTIVDRDGAPKRQGAALAASSSGSLAASPSSSIHRAPTTMSRPVSHSTRARSNAVRRQRVSRWDGVIAIREVEARTGSRAPR